MCLEDDEGIGSTESNDSFERELHFSFVYSALCLPSGAVFLQLFTIARCEEVK